MSEELKPCQPFILDFGEVHRIAIHRDGTAYLIHEGDESPLFGEQRGMAVAAAHARIAALERALEAADEAIVILWRNRLSSCPLDMSHPAIVRAMAPAVRAAIKESER